MAVVFPNKQGNMAVRLLRWPLVFVTVLWHHPALGMQYAGHWANRSLDTTQKGAF